MTPEQIVAWIKDTRGIALAPDSARRLAGLLASGRTTLDALTDDSLFDAEPAQMAIALKECAE
jgi:hypothetical protein